MRRDLILSSGFLAFARHVGFLRAVEETGFEARAVCGTSSGALVGSLWAAGMPALEIEAQLSAHRPLGFLRPSLRPWRGLFSTGPLTSKLAALLPATFAELERPLGVGVRSGDGGPELLRAGALPEAVAASCAIPVVFEPVAIGGGLLSDGGSVDRLGLQAWRSWRPGRKALVHWVERTRGTDAPSRLDGCGVVRTPPSSASFWGLGDFAAQVEEARVLTLAVLEEREASEVSAT